MSGAVVTLATVAHGRLGIEAGELQLWWARLDDLAADEAWYEAALSADELERAMAFRFAADRRRFTLARGALRALLGRYLGVEPRAVAFVYGPQGKPALAARPELHFNLSHARDCALYAVARGRPVGVDLEFIDRSLDLAATARYACGPAERRALAACPPQLRHTLFYTYWVRKEALIKAHGGGMLLGLPALDVSAPAERAVGGSAPPGLVVTLPTAGPYLALDLAGAPGAVACCALAGPEPPLRRQEGLILPAAGCNRSGRGPL